MGARKPSTVRLRKPVSDLGPVAQKISITGSDHPHKDSARSLIGYARSFSKDDVLESQLEALKAAGCRKVYVDLEDLSGELAQLKLAVTEMIGGETLVVWRLDRLAPSIRQLSRLVDDLTTRGVALWALVEDIDTASALGSAYVRAFRAIDDFERAVIREKTIVGQRKASAEGRRAGRRPKITAEHVELALTYLKDPAVSVESAAARCGVSTSTLYRVLQQMRERRP